MIIFNYILTTSIGAGITYLTTYLNEKVKNTRQAKRSAILIRYWLNNSLSTAVNMRKQFELKKKSLETLKLDPLNQESKKNLIVGVQEFDLPNQIELIDISLLKDICLERKINIEGLLFLKFAENSLVKLLSIKNIFNSMKQTHFPSTLIGSTSDENFYEIFESFRMSFEHCIDGWQAVIEQQERVIQGVLCAFQEKICNPLRIKEELLIESPVEEQLSKYIKQ